MNLGKRTMRCGTHIATVLGTCLLTTFLAIPARSEVAQEWTQWSASENKANFRHQIQKAKEFERRRHRKHKRLVRQQQQELAYEHRATKEALRQRRVYEHHAAKEALRQRR